MVEQQLLKSFKLLSESQVYRFNDRRWPDMWYIVSATGYVFKCNAVPRNSGQIKPLLDSCSMLIQYNYHPALLGGVGYV